MLGQTTLKRGPHCTQTKHHPGSCIKHSACPATSDQGNRNRKRTGNPPASWGSLNTARMPPPLRTWYGRWPNTHMGAANSAGMGSTRRACRGAVCKEGFGVQAVSAAAHFPGPAVKLEIGEQQLRRMAAAGNLQPHRLALRRQHPQVPPALGRVCSGAQEQGGLQDRQRHGRASASQRNSALLPPSTN